jgi:diaminopimelate epimerase
MWRRFTKMHGAGNDFVVFDATRKPLELSAEQAAHIADRHFGVGCDQILIAEPAESPEVDFYYRILNSDGSEAEQCGNGARCFARFLRDEGLITSDTVLVQTMNRRMELKILRAGQVRVDMGVPEFEPARIPFKADRRADRYVLSLAQADVELGAVSMGNPHAVLKVDDVEHAAVETLGPAIQRHERFPNQVNVGFMQVVDGAHIRLRVYERGAGETLACGSGACAAVAAGRVRGWLGERVEVAVRGGILHLEWAGEGQPVYMTGPAEKVFTGEIDL